MIRRLAFIFAVSTLPLVAWAQGLRPVPPRIVVTGAAERPVELRSVAISSEVSGALAMTSVEMVFHNPNGRVLEGELQFPLLDGQTVVGFALDIDGRMREAVPVEKARAQMVFEEITRTRIDPAVVQVTEGNNYKVRVYPIPARGDRRVMLRYSESVPSSGNSRRYRLATNYPAALREFSLEMVVAGDAAPTASQGALDSTRFVRDGNSWRLVTRRPVPPSGVLEVAIPDSPAPRVLTQAFGGHVYFHAESRATSLQMARRLPKHVQIAWDASGSMLARNWPAERVLLDAYIAAARDIDVTLVKVRDTAEPAQRFRIRNGDWSALRASLEATDHDGATDLGAMQIDEQAQELLVFSDGLSNFGQGSLPVTRIPVFAISSTTRAAPSILRNLAESSGGRFIDLAADSGQAARDKLLRAATRVVAIDGDEVRDVVMLTPIATDGRVAVSGLLTARRGAVRLTVEQPDGKRTTVSIPLEARDREGRLAATTWAAWTVAKLEGDPDLNRGAIRRIGKEFGIATRETSLIVLDRVEDYARYSVEPPPELAEAYRRLVADSATRLKSETQSHVERIVARFREKQAWWDRDFPKDERSVAKAVDRPLEELRSPAAPAARVAPSTVATQSAPALASPPPADAGSQPPKPANVQQAATAIHLRPWRPDAPYATRMREASADRVYRVYLDERPDYVQSSAFFLDAADILIEKKQVDLAVRVLSNLAEMDLENRALLRILGYRLLQADRPQLAIAVFKKVLALAPEEPQSYRDLGLAYAADKQEQKAIDLLADVVMKPWHARFPDIELVALAELNAIAATAVRPLDTSRVDPRLLRNLPLDLRVVLTWDADNTDIDLWVTDPNGEKADYGHQLTYQGGRMSPDFTGGYGPEEFSLRKAKPGSYRVHANFYGHRQQIVAGATTLQVRLITGFGTPRAEERIVTLRLKGQREVVHVGDFEVGTGGKP